MSNCYKCGRELPGNQTECELFCAVPEGEVNNDELDRIEREFENDTLEVDWEKVTMFEQLRAIMISVWPEFRVYKDDPNIEQLRPILKPKEPNKP